MNERITENITKKILLEKGYDTADFIIEEQKSKSPRITKLLKNASKSGNGIGKPEFIITSNKDADFMIVIECKADIKNHISADLSRANDFAVDGAVHYASYLSKEFNVIAIGISGQTEKELLVDTYLFPKGEVEYKKLENIKEILSFDEYRRTLSSNSVIRKAKEAELMSFARDLHNQMRDYAKLSEAEKPLLVSAILMALEDEGFKASYRTKDKPEALSKALTIAIEDVLENAGMPNSKIKNLVQTYGFLNVHPELNRGTILMNLIIEIEENIRPFAKDYEFIDVIGKFYGEFLKYTGGDGKGLGIVLTPNHIAELFADMANLTPTSVVLDECMGTGGLLIAAMDNMIKKSGGDTNKIKNIKKNGLIGCEQQSQMFSLGVAGMLLRGDGKANVFLGSCFDQTEQFKKHKPTHLFLNPPYSQKGAGLSELDFIEHGLDVLQPNGMGFAIVPMSCALDTKNPIRERLLEKHTLEAVMSMPEDLFYPVGVVTCIMVFKAHVPHSKYHETWFSYWKDDGFEKTRNEGRVDLKHEYENRIKQEWLEMYHGRKEIPGMSVRKHVEAGDEWCAESYLITDLSTLTKEDFKNDLLEYMAFNLLSRNFDLVSEFIKEKEKEKTPELKVEEWKEFRLDELFDIEVGKGPSSKFANENAGNTPFISATANNNGVTSFTEYEPTHENNTITVSRNGSIGESFYQPTPFCATADVGVLNPRFENNQYISIFIATILKRERYKYNYGRKWNSGRMNNTIIKLPSTKEGNPDWKWMENYIKTLKFSGEV